MKINKSSLKLYASARAVINNYLNLPGKDRISHVVDRVASMSAATATGNLQQLMKEFGNRHRDITTSFLYHCHLTENKFAIDLSAFSDEKRILLGAFLTKEYSIQAAALFNPSIVPHPSQGGLNPGELRFVMSLRATGEGHISSIVFQTGILDSNGNVQLDPSTGYHTCLKRNEQTIYTKEFISERALGHPSFELDLLEKLPEHFTAAVADAILSMHDQTPGLKNSVAIIEEIINTNYDLEDSAHLSINEKVIFPIARGESMGMEDVRLVKFEQEGASIYYGTYTAYDGKQIRTQLIETSDFNTFRARTLIGAAIADKGMALFPEKIAGKYVMISRQGGENINIMFSENLYQWDHYQLLMAPKYSWELVQLGNCGSPIKTSKGWLLLTHGVGLMRKYVISAILLDLNDPRKITGRLSKPIIEANETEREGYVPNVVYTCGLLKHDNLLLIPYAVSDSATGFVTVELKELLDELLASD